MMPGRGWLSRLSLALMILLQLADGGCARFGKSGTNSSGGDASSEGYSNRYSLVFNGSDEHLQNAQSPVSAYPFTLAAWMRTSSATNEVIAGLFSSSVTNRYYRIRIVTTTGRVRAECSNTTVRSSELTGNFADGSWHFVVGVFLASNSRTVYVDGTAATTNTSACNFFAPDRTSIGRSGTSSPSMYFNGEIDEVAVWNVALSSAEITALYNSGAPLDLSTDSGDYVSSSSLVAWWRLGDLTGDDPGSSIKAAVGSQDLTTFNMDSGNLSTVVP